MDLRGRTLAVTKDWLEQNPRRPFTHGWLAFEVLRRAPGGTLSFEEYEQGLFFPDEQIEELAKQIPGVEDAYQDLKHIRCDVFRGTVVVSPPLERTWFATERCSGGGSLIPEEDILEPHYSSGEVLSHQQLSGRRWGGT